MKKTAIEKASYINEEYRKYLKSSYSFGNEELQKLFEDKLKTEALFKGPYLHMIKPFKKGKSLQQLIDENVVDAKFAKLNNVHLNRTLYDHQETAIRKIADNRNLVITTGTGSGKTESFLYPILNEIIKDKSKGNRTKGIRALFLYPMNALVNDQLDRLREILSTYPDITFGYFTGDTPNDYSNHNSREDIAAKNNCILPPNELVTREEIRNNPPDLLFTNYSMLEYLMIRPNDSSLFNTQSLENWKFVVLDEAHTYNGALGIELSMLLRRVTGVAKTKPHFILTSATLGEQGKSEDKIIKFANSLTSVDYSESDIIYANRINFSLSKNMYAVKGEDIEEIKSILNLNSNISAIENIVNKYCDTTSDSIPSMLYDLLSHDQNTYRLYELLDKGPKEIELIEKAFVNQLSEHQLASLIDLINFAEKDNIHLFDLKYHSFIRSLSGAYTTFSNPVQLTLTKTDYLNGYKAFELGNCKYCNATYIIGKIVNSLKNGKQYLIQNDEIDIYDNYDDNEDAKLDFFLINKPEMPTTQPEEENKENKENEAEHSFSDYTVCSKCGCIFKTANLNANTCDCGNEYQIPIYKVEELKKERLFNNIRTCPCCNRHKNAGIVKTVSIGQDESTSIIAQILYDSLNEYDNASTSNKPTKKIKLGRSNRNDKKEAIKQFLSFSDSRQQASFAAVFMENSQNRLIQKRLLLEVLEKNNMDKINTIPLASLLTDIIKDKQLFGDKLTAEEYAWICILKELLLIDGQNSAEGLGLLYFELNIDSLMKKLDEDTIIEATNELNMEPLSLKQFHDLVEIILNTFRTVPAINYSRSGLSEETKLNQLDYRRFSNYVSLQEPKKMKNTKKKTYIRGLLPTNASNSLLEYVQRALSCSCEQAKEFITLIFETVTDPDYKLLEKKDDEEAYRINISNYDLKRVTNRPIYRCSKCGKVTPYNINNTCLSTKCKGKLVLIDPDEEFENNYYYRQYKTKKVERIIIQEHTAQLERKKAKDYQKDFKNKKINILSCSTTFEMGVDIGDLETVYMRNVPPTPANYVQRAGRAGRRKDSSAFILTYCGTKSHDFSYFDDPKKMIAGIINPPYFDIVNEKIIVRHLIAASLGYFFKLHPEYFKSVNDFVFNGGIECFKAYMESKPQNLNDYINNKILYNIDLPIKNYQWYENEYSDNNKLDTFASSVSKEIKELENAKQQAVKEDNGRLSDSLKYQIQNILSEKLLDNLSKYGVIPKYGFPVDVVNLEVYQNGFMNRKIDLNRDLKTAISEYAPDSEIIADGEKYTSKYINLPKQGDFPLHYYNTCPNCNRENISYYKESLAVCRNCNAQMSLENVKSFIIPKLGFKTGKNVESTRMKPKRSYSGELTYVGNAKEKQTLDLGFMKIESTTDDELCIKNKSNFYYCRKCGYAKIDKRLTVPTTHEKHSNYRDFQCDNDELVKVNLGHTFKTDVTRFIIPSLIGFESNRHKALSFLYAFLEGISMAFNIERNDIDGLIERNNHADTIDILIFDNVPGGAGHSKRLLNKDEIIQALKMALVKVSQNCCDENTSCYNCLRNYYNQAFHKYLKRGDAKEVIIELLNKFDDSISTE